ncbi:MAG: phosphoribosylformylglycinamidine synthase [Bacteriovoracaceae bacterium]|jgi:phosphoribosylformylglycinamidine synthase subunit PurSL|nr:phosphoribosylformylglycinamidine synthase [Bacteriovoracaceae bacterium]
MKRIEISEKDQISFTQGTIKRAHDFFELEIEAIEKRQIYWIDARNSKSAPSDIVDQISKNVLSHPLAENTYLTKDYSKGQFNYLVEVNFLPGVTDNTAGGVVAATHLYCDLDDIKAHTGTLYLIRSTAKKEQIESFVSQSFANPLLQNIHMHCESDEIAAYAPFENFPDFECKGTDEKLYELTNLNQDIDSLYKLSREKLWNFEIDELKYIQSFYKKEDILKSRSKLGLPAEPTDVELEVMAQSWSEHCKHKIFAADIEYTEKSDNSYHSVSNATIGGLFPTYIKGATNHLIEKEGIDFTRSLFVDNAGVVNFDEGVDLCVKVETHNSPSVLDPYGGSLTGILGVNRDILGTGMGAIPLANIDVFCFGKPEHDTRHYPKTVKSTKHILEGVHKGIIDGGNKSGIPTINGSFSFHRNFGSRPLIFCGTIGAMKPGDHKKMMNEGDRVFMIGGLVGKDGIHGATFSSRELDQSSPLSAVQIGDPFTQRLVWDFLEKARELKLYSSITDNGAGGLSSSVGEMACETGGAVIDLKKVGLKYPGLAPYEIMISESQERMTLSVPSENVDEFESLAQSFGVEHCNLGEFNSSGHLHVCYGDETVAYLNLSFLHETLPKLQLKAKWSPGCLGEIDLSNTETKQTPSIDEALLELLAHPNICSKESYVRQYDFEVGGLSAVKPFGGKSEKTANNSGVIWLGPMGSKNQSAGVCLGHGITHSLSFIDPYLAGIYAVDEAMRNILSTGADITKVCITDNFCMPDPLPGKSNVLAEEKLGSLVRLCEGLKDAAIVYKAPLVSGKDSMKNDFMGESNQGEMVRESIPPTLLVTAMAHVNDIAKTLTSDFKNSFSSIYAIGEGDTTLLGSHYQSLFQVSDNSIPKVPDLEKNYQLFRALSTATSKALVESCHDISDGGLLVTISESMIGGDLGAVIDLDIRMHDLRSTFFNESPGRFVVSVANDQVNEFENTFKGLPVLKIGQTSLTQKLVVNNSGKLVFSTALDDLSKAWRSSLWQK